VTLATIVGPARGANIAVACGGTGGHVFPGLAVGQVLRRRGHAVTLWIGSRSVEQCSVGNWAGPVVRTAAAGFPGFFSPRTPGAILLFLRSFLASSRRLREERPAVLLATGGYASVGPVLAARRLRIPIVLHEANAVPGLAIAWLGRFARAIAVSFDETAARLRHPNIVPTGYPVREDLEGEPFGDPLRPGLFTVLVMGGSQGAHRLNQLAVESIARLQKQGAPVQIVHLAGTADEDWVRESYRTAGVPHIVKGFLTEMGRAYSTAEFAVARAGAGSCFELAARTVPALLVPLPSARRDHQMANARAFEARGAVDVSDQRDLTVEKLVAHIESRRKDPGRLDSMRRALAALDATHAAARIADLVEETAGLKSSRQTGS